MNQNTSGSATTDAENVVDLSSLQDPVAETEALAVALAPLGKIGVPVANFTRPQIHAIFLSVPSYIKEIKGLTSISSEEMLAEVFNTAVMNGICKIPSVCDVTSILNVARWIKKGKGAKCVADVQHALKLKSKATHGATPQQVALAQILDQQMQDMAGEVKRVRNDSELKISRWQKKINNERRKMDKALKGIESRYVPANSFKPLEREEVSRRCWEKYEADCRKKGTQPAPWSSIIMARVEADWGNQVQAEHRQEFVTNAQVADQLNEWGKHKIAQLKLDQDFRSGENLKRLVAAAGGGKAVESSSGGEEEAGGLSPSRESEEVHGAGQQQQADDTPESRTPPGQKAGRGQDASGSKKRKRNRRSKRINPGLESSGKRTKRTQEHEARRDSDGEE
ncbi:TPA_asm: hypothetical protein [Acer pseudosieboldianum amalgavirus 1]|nr:TPA_asm: hypothetical protein [Acer pseudosieboldianum amalgavirus 1]